MKTVHQRGFLFGFTERGVHQCVHSHSQRVKTFMMANKQKRYNICCRLYKYASPNTRQHINVHVCHLKHLTSILPPNKSRSGCTYRGVSWRGKFSHLRYSLYNMRYSWTASLPIYKETSPAFFCASAFLVVSCQRFLDGFVKRVTTEAKSSFLVSSLVWVLGLLFTTGSVSFSPSVGVTSVC